MFFNCQLTHRLSTAEALHGALTQGKGKGKAIPTQAWIGPEVSKGSRIPDFSHKHLPTLSPVDIPGTHFC